MRQTSLCSFCRAIWLLPPTFVILDGLCLSSILGWFSCPLIGASQMDLKKPFMITNDHYKSWWLAFFFLSMSSVFDKFVCIGWVKGWLKRQLAAPTTCLNDNNQGRMNAHAYIYVSGDSSYICVSGSLLVAQKSPTNPLLPCLRRNCLLKVPRRRLGRGWESTQLLHIFKETRFLIAQNFKSCNINAICLNCLYNEVNSCSFIYTHNVVHVAPKCQKENVRIV